MDRLETLGEAIHIDMPPKKKTKAASSADEDNGESDGYMSASDSASSVDSTMVGDQTLPY